MTRSRPVQRDAISSDEEVPPEDLMMDDESDVPAEKPKRKKQVKKVIPVGRNGLKKKRVVKSRMTTDEKGYMGEYIIATNPDDYSGFRSDRGLFGVRVC